MCGNCYITIGDRTLKPEDMKFIVMGDRIWGKGNTLTEAIANMRKNGRSTKYVAYLVHPDSTVTDMGDISYPLDFPPKKIHQVGIK